MFSPGQLSQDWSEGKRVRYMRPIALFLLGNLIYFLFPIFQIFVTSLNVQLQMPYAEFLELSVRVEQKILELNLTQEAFEREFGATSDANSRLMLIVLIPMYALLFALVGGKTKADRRSSEFGC